MDKKINSIENMLNMCEYDTTRTHDALTVGVTINDTDNKMDIVVYVQDIEVAIGHEMYTFKINIGTRWTVTIDRSPRTNDIVIEFKDTITTYTVK